MLTLDRYLTPHQPISAAGHGATLHTSIYVHAGDSWGDVWTRLEHCLWYDDRGLPDRSAEARHAVELALASHFESADYRAPVGASGYLTMLGYGEIARES